MKTLIPPAEAAARALLAVDAMFYAIGFDNWAGLCGMIHDYRFSTLKDQGPFHTAIATIGRESMRLRGESMGYRGRGYELTCPHGYGCCQNCQDCSKEPKPYAKEPDRH